MLVRSFFYLIISVFLFATPLAAQTPPSHEAIKKSMADEEPFILDQKGDIKQKLEWEIFLPQVATEASGQTHNYYLIQQDGKLGIMNEQQEILLSPIYRSITLEEEASDKMIVKDTTGLVGYYQYRKGFLLPVRYQSIQDMGNVFQVTKETNSEPFDKNRHAILDKSGNELINGNFQFVYKLTENYFITKDNHTRLWRIYDLTGQPLIDEYYLKLGLQSNFEYALLQGAKGIAPDQNLLETFRRANCSLHPRALALLDLKTGQRLTEFLYKKIIPDEPVNGQQTFTAEHLDSKQVTLNANDEEVD